MLKSRTGAVKRHRNLTDEGLTKLDISCPFKAECQELPRLVNLLTIDLRTPSLILQGGGSTGHNSAFGISSFIAQADEVECDASAPGKISADVWIFISCSPVAPDGMVSPYKASRLCAQSSRYFATSCFTYAAVNAGSVAFCAAHGPASGSSQKFLPDGPRADAAASPCCRTNSICRS